VEEGDARTCPRCGVPLVARTVQAQPAAPQAPWVRTEPVGGQGQPGQPYTATRPLDLPWQTAQPGNAAPAPGPRSVPTAPNPSAWARPDPANNQPSAPRPYAVANDTGGWVRGGQAAPAMPQATQLAQATGVPPIPGQVTATSSGGGVGRNVWYGAGFGFVGSIAASVILGVLNVQSADRWGDRLTLVALIVGAVTGALVPAPLSAYPALLAGAPGRAFRNGALAAILGAIIMALTALALVQVASVNDVFFRGDLIRGALIWIAFGLVLGIVDGIVARAPRRVFLGGIGGALGGLIAFLLGYLLKNEGSFVVVGLLIGLGSGLIQEVAKQAWVTIIGGPNVHTQAIIDKAVVRLGSSEDADIDVGLYRDAAVAPRHFEIRRQAGDYLLAVLPNAGPLAVNGELVQRERRLKGGDRIQIGNTILQFNTRAS
jgi:hypothetical protein